VKKIKLIKYPSFYYCGIENGFCKFDTLKLIKKCHMFKPTDNLLGHIGYNKTKILMGEII